MDKLEDKKKFWAKTIKSHLDAEQNANLQDKAIFIADELLGMYEDLSFTKENIDKYISEIYRIIHSANKYSSCYDAHDDWRKETELKFYNNIIDFKERFKDCL